MTNGREARKEDFQHPSLMFRAEDRLKGWVGGPLYYGPIYRSFGGFSGDEQVLDFGCGGGASTRTIAAALKNGGSVIGVDPSRFFTARAARRLNRAPNATVLCGEVSGLDLPRQRFDVVTILHVIHDIPSPKRSPAVNTIGALLKPGGKVWIAEPTKPTHGMAPDEIRSLMREAGLKELTALSSDKAFRGVYEKRSD